MITASYSGDSSNAMSSGTYILANFATAATSAESSSTSTSSGGTATADQQATGVDVGVSGAPENTPITLLSADLQSQPPSTGILSINGLGFYDVEISGITTGTANVCIYNAGVTASTVLEYYSGGSWLSATGVVDTPGVSTCGNIPVAALNGTPVVFGNPLATTTATVSCTSPVTVGAPSACSATVTGYGTPTGAVSFSASGSGKFAHTELYAIVTLVLRKLYTDNRERLAADDHRHLFWRY